MKCGGLKREKQKAEEKAKEKAKEKVKDLPQRTQRSRRERGELGNKTQRLRYFAGSTRSG